MDSACVSSDAPGCTGGCSSSCVSSHTTTCSHRCSDSHDEDSSDLSHAHSNHSNSSISSTRCSSTSVHGASKCGVHGHHHHHHHADHHPSGGGCGGGSGNSKTPAALEPLQAADGGANGTAVCDSGCGCEKLHEQLHRYANQQQQQQQPAIRHDHEPAGAMLPSLFRGSSVGPVVTRIHAAGICCPMESRLIHSILDVVPGVLSVDVTVVMKMVTVHHEPRSISPAALIAALNSAGLQASLTSRSSTQGTPSTGQQQQQQQGLWQLLNRLQHNSLLPPVTVLFSGLLLLLSLVLLLPGVPAAAPLEHGLLALIGAAVGIPPVLRKAWAGLKGRNLDMNCLGVCGCLGEHVRLT